MAIARPPVHHADGNLDAIPTFPGTAGGENIPDTVEASSSKSDWINTHFIENAVKKSHTRSGPDRDRGSNLWDRQRISLRGKLHAVDVNAIDLCSIFAHRKVVPCAEHGREISRRNELRPGLWTVYMK